MKAAARNNMRDVTLLADLGAALDAVDEVRCGVAGTCVLLSSTEICPYL